MFNIPTKIEHLEHVFITDVLYDADIHIQKRHSTVCS